LIASSYGFCQEGDRQRGSQGSFDVALQAGLDDQPPGAIHSDAYLQEATVHLSIQQNRTHRYWSVDYRPTFLRYDNLSAANRVDHDLQFEGGARFSRRWSLELYSRFLDSSNPFLRAEGSLSASGQGNSSFLGPNFGVVGPTRAYRTINNTLTLHYQLGPHTRLNFGANYFRDDEKDVPLLSGDTRSLSAEFEKRLRPRDTAGVSYSVQLFRVTAASIRVRVQSLLFVYSHEWRSGTQLNIFAGPQFSLLQAEPTASSSFLFFETPVLVRLRQPNLGYTAGASLTRRLTERASFDIAYSHRITDGGGIARPLVQDSGLLGFHQKLKKHINVSLTADYSQNRPLGGLGYSTAFPAWGVSPQIEVSLTQHASMTGFYNFSWYERLPAELQWLQQHNRLLIGLHYSLGAFPLGR
jgi:hypothetical protein